MKIARTSFVLTGGLLITISAFGYFFWYRTKFQSSPEAETFKINENFYSNRSGVLLRVKQKALLAKDYIKENGFDADHCFLLDMKIPSGKNRFFVYNLSKDSVEVAGLVTHGSGSQEGEDGLIFSNTPNSHCTSLGKYKIGNAYNGVFGLAFKLHGLDKTNSKAFDRFVVLHGHSCVPNEELYPLSICLSQGCPTVAPDFLTRLKGYLDSAKEPVLLWIYY